MKTGKTSKFLATVIYVLAVIFAVAVMVGFLKNPISGECEHEFDKDKCVKCGKLLYSEITVELLNEDLTVYTVTDLSALKDYIKVTALDINNEYRELKKDEYDLSGYLYVYDSAGYSTITVTQISTQLQDTFKVAVIEDNIKSINVSLAGNFILNLNNVVDDLRQYIVCTYYLESGGSGETKAYELSISTDDGKFVLGNNTVRLSYEGFVRDFTVNVVCAEHNFVNGKCTYCNIAQHKSIKAIPHDNYEIYAVPDVTLQSVKDSLDVVVTDVYGNNLTLGYGDYTVTGEIVAGVCSFEITHIVSGLKCTVNLEILAPFVTGIRVNYSGENVHVSDSVDVLRQYITCVYSTQGYEEVTEDYELRIINTDNFVLGENDVEVIYCGFIEVITVEATGHDFVNGKCTYCNIAQYKSIKATDNHSYDIYANPAYTLQDVKRNLDVVVTDVYGNNLTLGYADYTVTGEIVAGVCSFEITHIVSGLKCTVNLEILVPFITEIRVNYGGENVHVSDSVDVLRQYITCVCGGQGYEEVTEDYELRIKNSDSFALGENEVEVKYGGCIEVITVVAVE